ncbi:MAG: hypothetical protein GF364_11025 [Candidatus Lokiarchaeota archaeon]|nr:hypothetical protein [Candidatus Lokiarchaeota archaeon]
MLIINNLNLIVNKARNQTDIEKRYIQDYKSPISAVLCSPEEVGQFGDGGDAFDVYI